MKKLKYATWILLLTALVASVITTFVLLQQRDSFKQDIKNAVISQIQSELRNIPIPRDGLNGKDATPEQISLAVSTYFSQNPVKNGINGKNGTNGSNATDQQVQQAVNNYLANNPVKNGQDGSNGLDGKTPQIRCNVVKNRWEVRYSDTENWQALNGQTTKCTISTE